ncbi:MAG: hypothetical protein HN413_01020 [Chloroflexi bacterium]|nr:hypothetical protein [Chloroflexota bacterium]
MKSTRTHRNSQAENRKAQRPVKWQAASRPQGQRQPQSQTPVPALRRRTSASYWIWSMSDLGTLYRMAEIWITNLTDPGTTAFYAGGMALLTVGAGFLTWGLDINPSLIFGQHLATQLVSEWTSQRILVMVVFLFSIMPNLMELFAVGLAAHGNIVVDIAIKATLLFDAATDSPMAFSIAQAIVRFFLPDGTAASLILSGLVAIPVLALATIIVEILFLSFLVATVLLVRHSFSLRRNNRFGR